MMDKHINISVVKSLDTVMDIRIPSAITVTELLVELKKINLISNTNSFYIKELNRGIILSDTDQFDEYRIADGDRIQLNNEG